MDGWMLQAATSRAENEANVEVPQTALPVPVHDNCTEFLYNSPVYIL